MADFYYPLKQQITEIRDKIKNRNSPAYESLNFPQINFGMTNVRGMLIPHMDGGKKLPFDLAIVFQFNPETITTDKQNNRGVYNRLGYAYDIPFWVSGGPKTISFKLFLDATAGSNFRIFSARKSTDYNDNTMSGAYVNFDDVYKSGMADSSEGLWPDIHRLEALQYPFDKKANDLVSFSNEMPKLVDGQPAKFDNPPKVVFSYGNLLAVTDIAQMTRTDTLFNRALNPVRCEFDIQLLVNEAKVVDTNFIAGTNQNRQSRVNNGNFGTSPDPQNALS